MIVEALDASCADAPPVMRRLADALDRALCAESARRDDPHITDDHRCYWIDSASRRVVVGHGGSTFDVGNVVNVRVRINGDTLHFDFTASTDVHAVKSWDDALAYLRGDS